MSDKLDGGYGNIGNMSMYIFLELLSEEDRKRYEEHLRQKDLQAYDEYKEWEENMNG